MVKEDRTSLFRSCISHILRSYHLFQNGTIIKNIAIQMRSMYKYWVMKSARTLSVIERDDIAKGL